MFPRKANLFPDDRGSLGVLEFANLPFEPQRFFWIYDVPSYASRAGHGHKTCRQILFSLRGNIELKVIDKNKTTIEYKLNPGDVVYLEALNWLEITNFGDGGMLGVLASEPYDRAEYIENFDDFLKLIQDFSL